MRRSGWLAALAVVATALVFSFPPPQGATPVKLFPDSIAYLRGGYGRPPTASVFYALVPEGRAICIAQTVLSVVCWTALGWCVLGVAGAICAAALAASLPVSIWNLAVLSESLGLSLGAALFAATLALGRQWTWGRFALWAACAVLFIGVRVEHVVLIPILGGALLAWYRSRWPALGAVAVIAAAGFVVFGVVLDERSENWDARMTNIVLARILLDANFAAHFHARGLPEEDALLAERGKLMQSYEEDFRARTPEFQRWLKEDSRSVYLRWLATWAPHRQLLAAMDGITARGDYEYYVNGMRPPGAAVDLVRVYDAMALPFRMWACLAIVPVLCAALSRRLRFIDVFALASIVGVYALSFVAYHGDAAEVPRHMALAAALYRMAPLIVLGSIWERAAQPHAL